MRGVYDCVHLVLWRTLEQTRLSKNSCKKDSADNGWDFKCLQGLSLPIMNETFMSRNIPYIIRNLRGLDSQLPKTTYCELDYNLQLVTIMKQLPEKINFSLVSFNQSIEKRP